MEPVIQRQTAKIASIGELLSGDYVVQDGWKPNYIQTKNRRLTRVNVIAIIIEKPSPFELVIDDGSGSIIVNDFNRSKSTSISKVGQPVLIVGRPRRANDSIFIAAEIVQPNQLIKNSIWLIKRKNDLKAISEDVSVDDEYESIKSPEPLKSDSNNAQKEFKDDSHVKSVSDDSVDDPESFELNDDSVISFIRKHDSGTGCDIESIIGTFGQEADNTILTLIAMGEIYEIKPGKIKVLE